jgi:hypothetical protein
MISYRPLYTSVHLRALLKFVGNELWVLIVSILIILVPVSAVFPRDPEIHCTWYLRGIWNCQGIPHFQFPRVFRDVDIEALPNPHRRNRV